MLNLSEIRSLLITGASGFVGRSLIDFLGNLTQEREPLEIVLVSRNGIDFPLPTNLKKITRNLELDLKHPWRIRFQPSHVIHLAADGTFAPYSTDASASFELIISNLISWISTCEEKPKLFHASSGACFEYESNSSRNKLFIPKYEFAKTRKKAEDSLKMASKQLNFDISIARLFSFSGTHLLQKRHYAISDFIRSAVINNTVHLKGNPNTIRSYLHQESMAEWIFKALVNPYSYTDLQIGSNVPVRLGVLAKYVSEITSTSVSFAQNWPLPDTYLPNNEETKAKLLVEEGKSWEIAVEEMVNEMRVQYGKI